MLNLVYFSLKKNDMQKIMDKVLITIRLYNFNMNMVLKPI